jgi:hypothetical protein
MTDALALSGMIQSLNAIAQLSKAAIGIRDAALIREKLVELNGEVLSAQAGALATQADQFALLERISRLEKQIADFEAWKAEADTYQLKDVSQSGIGGLLAFVPKAGTHDSEPPHSLCAQCYNERRKSFLQPEDRNGLCKVLACHYCGSDLYLTGARRPDHIQSKSATRRK